VFADGAQPSERKGKAACNVVVYIASRQPIIFLPMLTVSSRLRCLRLAPRPTRRCLSNAVPLLEFHQFSQTVHVKCTFCINRLHRTNCHCSRQPNGVMEAQDSNSTSQAEQPSLPETNPPNPRLQSLHNKHAQLEQTLLTLQAERANMVSQTKLQSGLSMPDTWSDEEKAKAALASANAVIKEHIQLLHRYNEIKDIGQGLMGLIADKRGARIKEIMEDYGMGDKD